MSAVMGLGWRVMHELIAISWWDLAPGLMHFVFVEASAA
jgi:hypothetical protein